MEKTVNFLYKILDDIKANRISFAVVSLTVFLLTALLCQKIDILVLLTAFLSAFISIMIANKNNEQQQVLLNKQIKEQQRQIIKAPYIQHEAKILIEFREIVYNSENAIIWFMGILRPYKIMVKMYPTQDVKLKDKDLIVPFEDYCKNYDILNELNNFYNKNQLILKKNYIEKEFIYITALLSTISWFQNKDDFYYTLISEDSKCIKYKLNVINKIGQLFVSSIDFEKNTTDFLPSFTEEKLQTYSNNIMSEYFNLKQKIDELTTFYDGDLPDNLKMIRIKIFPASRSYVKNFHEVSNEK